MKKMCAILGAGGHGKIVAELAILNGYSDITFFDDSWPQVTNVEQWAVAGNKKVLLSKVIEYDLTVIAIGNNEIRCALQRELKKAGAKFGVLAHPTSVISSFANVGAGTVLMANAVVNPFAKIGNSCIVNTNAVIEHDCVLADGVHISPGANLAGGVEVGKDSWLGIGCQIKQLVVIGVGVVVGAGSTVLHDIPDYWTVAGNPAKPLKTK
ncbi:acetyltransferase [Paraferrimonas haliotis]|uniref:acetyltransferase n=1 Tax=Paraferrimonas haliotis TaxID=2013866 RepID=UPI000BA948F0|nr:acetyltransferase [Paraferrimonas haliotis]